MIKLLSTFAINFYLRHYSRNGLFLGAAAFNQPLAQWDTSLVTSS